MPGPDHLRVVDFGTATPLRSQTLWHAIAYGVSEGAPPTLSFVRPGAPYVSIGYHRRLAEVDVGECADRGWPVYRRMVGGGPVYLDDGQLFFQITVPMSAVPPARSQALRWLLEPAVQAFRACGVDAALDDHNEIVVGDRKVCGYGAGQIGDAAIVVGNLIQRFDHRAAAAVLRSPSAAARGQLHRLMSRYVAATPADPCRFREAACDRYGAALGLAPRPGELSSSERTRLAELDQRFEDPHWLAGPPRPQPQAWQVKVRAGVWVFSAEDAGTEIVLGVREGTILDAAVRDPSLNGTATTLAGSLPGLGLDQAAAALARHGPAGRRLSQLVDLAQPRRL